MRQRRCLSGAAGAGALPHPGPFVRALNPAATCEFVVCAPRFYVREARRARVEGAALGVCFDCYNGPNVISILAVTICIVH